MSLAPGVQPVRHRDRHEPAQPAVTARHLAGRRDRHRRRRGRARVAVVDGGGLPRGARPLGPRRRRDDPARRFQPTSCRARSRARNTTSSRSRPASRATRAGRSSRASCTRSSTCRCAARAPAPTCRSAASASGRWNCAPGFRIVAGRMFRPGQNEVIVGRGVFAQFGNVDLGREVKWGSQTWRVVGVFEAGGSVSESEVWTDAVVLRGVYRRGNTVQIVRAQLESPGRARARSRRASSTIPRLNVSVRSERAFYADQSRILLGADQVRRHDARGADGRRRGVRRAQHDVFGGVRRAPARSPRCARLASVRRRSSRRCCSRRRCSGLLGGVDRRRCSCTSC